MSESLEAGSGAARADGFPTAFEPRIVAFFCNWCTYTAADLAGVSRMKYAPNSRVIRVMCSGRIDPQFVLDAFAHGADGVLIGGCHPGDCHYQEGNTKCLRRARLLRRILAGMGIEPERFRLEWISAAEGDRVRVVVDDMTARLRALGPLDLPGRFAAWDEEIDGLVARVEEAHAAGRSGEAAAPGGSGGAPAPARSGEEVRHG